jgi:hypothetical protein
MFTGTNFGGKSMSFSEFAPITIMLIILIALIALVKWVNSFKNEK